MPFIKNDTFTRLNTQDIYIIIGREREMGGFILKITYCNEMNKFKLYYNMHGWIIWMNFRRTENLEILSFFYLKTIQNYLRFCYEYKIYNLDRLISDHFTIRAEILRF